MNKKVLNSKNILKGIGGVKLNKKTVAVEMGLGEIAEALKVEGFNVVSLDQAKGYVDAVVYTKESQNWSDMIHNTTRTQGLNNMNFEDSKTIDASDMTSRDVVTHVKKMLGEFK